MSRTGQTEPVEGSLMYSLSFEQFSELSKQGNIVPLYQEISADLDTPVSAFLKIQSGQHDFLFESVVGGEKWGRYSFLGTQPSMIFRSKGQEVEIIRSHSREKRKTYSDPLLILRDMMKSFKPVKVEPLPRFFGGMVGYLSYDVARSFEKLPSTAADELSFPESYFILTDTVVIFDNLKQVMLVVANLFIDDHRPLKEIYEEGLHKIEKIVLKLKGGVPSKNFKSPGEWGLKSQQVDLKPLHSEIEFCTLVEKAKKYIEAGDIFQVQISTRFESKVEIEPIDLYRSIRRLNPSPYLFFLKLEDIALVGASPEVMVRLDDGKVAMRPIAGTRRRGSTPADDLRLEKQLKSDPKELAEHVMLVDLGRNDLGRVCKIGTVKVDEQEVVERYSHVMHLVSHVSGEIKEGKDWYDVLRAVFPAGTLTGAPKIRAMEIIEQLEGRRRGIYGGAVGYISFNGNMDTAITIRTAVFSKGKIYIQAAAGIVYDSKPEHEYMECQNKARAMIRALENIEQ